MKPSPNALRAAALREIAAHWAVRRDRGLSAAESIEFELWLAADDRHAAALRRAASAWSVLDRLPESVAAPVLAAAARRRVFWRRATTLGSLAAAAALLLGGFLAWRTPASAPASSAVTAAAAGPRELTLSDGTIVQINTGGEVLERFTAAERSVLLARGEAHFAVTKDLAWPFVVYAGTLRVQAVGTAFNVNLQAERIEVLVTEGRVRLGPAAPASGAGPAASTPALPLVEAGERAVVTGRSAAGAPAVTVSRVDGAEISRELAWQAPLLRLGGATLAEIVLEFQRRSGQRVVLADPTLAQLRVGGRFRADDAAGFARIMAATFDLEVERADDGTLVLRKKEPKSP